jgi:osmotically-inducible protein OsmY
MSHHTSTYAYPANTSDADLERRVRAYLVSRGFLSFRRLEIESRGAIVTLTGTLSTYYERQVALKSARRVAGILGVVDGIRVAPERPDSPPRFARALQILEQPEFTAVGCS